MNELTEDKSTHNRQLIDEEAINWQRFEQLPFYELLVFDFKHQVKEVYEDREVSTLFNDDEVAARRAKLEAEGLEEARTYLFQKLYPTKWLCRLKHFLQPPKDLRSVELQYIKRGKYDAFHAQLSEWKHRYTPKSYLPVDRLFSRDEVLAQLKPKIEPLQTQLIEELSQYRQLLQAYHEHLSELSPDDIDRSIIAMQRSYIATGRKREWYENFFSLIKEVLQNVRSDDSDGMNEPSTRVLQQDFLLTMGQRLVSYARYQQLSKLQFEPGHETLARQMSRPFQPTKADDRLLRHSQIFEDFLELVESLELTLESAQPTRTQPRVFDASTIDQTKRIAAWQEFKAINENDPENIAEIFKRLKSILDQNQDWYEIHRDFRALLQIKRRQDSSSLSHQAELSEAREFVTEMVQLVDEDIELDVEFEIQRQNLASANRYEDLVAEVKRQLEEARKFSHRERRPILKALKLKFLSAVTDSTKENNRVVPLFRR